LGCGLATVGIGDSLRGKRDTFVDAHVELQAAYALRATGATRQRLGGSAGVEWSEIEALVELCWGLGKTMSKPSAQLKHALHSWVCQE
jgi:hypothetical protein